LQLAPFELLQSFPHRPRSIEINLQTGGRQHICGVRSQTSRNHRVSPCIDDDLGGLDACTAAQRGGLVVHNVKRLGCGVNDDKILTTPESWVNLCFQIGSFGRNRNLHETSSVGHMVSVGNALLITSLSIKFRAMKYRLGSTRFPNQRYLSKTRITNPMRNPAERIGLAFAVYYRPGEGNRICMQISTSNRIFRFVTKPWATLSAGNTSTGLHDILPANMA
jgi:hypothetical protein